jgi:hypothetical protein
LTKYLPPKAYDIIYGYIDRVDGKEKEAIIPYLF